MTLNHRGRPTKGPRAMVTLRVRETTRQRIATCAIELGVSQNDIMVAILDYADWGAALERSMGQR